MRDKRVQNICLNGIVAALYIAFTMINPLSWAIIQFRFSDMLSALAYYRKRFVGGFLVGCTLANFFSPLGMIDMLFGFLSEGLPIAIFVYGFGKDVPMWIKNIGRAIIIGIVIGAELTLVYSAPFIAGFLSLFVSEIIIFAVGVVVMKPILGILKQLNG